MEAEEVMNILANYKINSIGKLTKILENYSRFKDRARHSKSEGELLDKLRELHREKHILDDNDLAYLMEVLKIERSSLIIDKLIENGIITEKEFFKELTNRYIPFVEQILKRKGLDLSVLKDDVILKEGAECPRCKSNKFSIKESGEMTCKSCGYIWYHYSRGKLEKGDFTQISIQLDKFDIESLIKQLKEHNWEDIND